MRSAIVFGLIFALGFVAVSANHRTNVDSAETTAVQNEVRNQRRNTEKMEGDGMDKQTTPKESSSGDDTSNEDSAEITEGENGLGNGGRNNGKKGGGGKDKQKTSRKSNSTDKNGKIKRWFGYPWGFGLGWGWGCGRLGGWWW